MKEGRKEAKKRSEEHTSELQSQMFKEKENVVDELKTGETKHVRRIEEGRKEAKEGSQGRKEGRKEGSRGRKSRK